MGLSISVISFVQLSMYRILQTTAAKNSRQMCHCRSNWWHEFLNYFDDRVTNGFVEGINRAIRVIINRAYGYRNFENFRLQVLAQHGDLSYPTNLC
jgi:transposase